MEIEMEGNEQENQEQESALAEFDAKGFMNDESRIPAEERREDDEESEEPEGEKQETDDGASDSGSEQDQGGGVGGDVSDWSLETESSSTEESDEDSSEDDAEGAESSTQDTSSGWEAIAETLGIEAEDYDTFVDTLKGQQQLASKGATNDKIEGFNNLIKMDDETLMKEELKARGFSSEEIEDELDIMIENNTIRSKARQVRKDLEAVRAQEKDAMANTAQQTDATQQQEQEKAENDLREHMSKTSEMFGGKINGDQQSAHVDYIAKGTFFDEVTATPQSMAEAAWLWRYRGQILKGMRSAGVEKGKSAILDRMTNPEPTRRTNIPDPVSGEFNPNRFLDAGEQM